MGFISCANWRDLTDGHLYREGEPFPFDGREISPERLDELMNVRNRAGLVLIRAIEVQNEPEEALKEEEPKKAPEGRKTAPAKKRTTTKK